MRYTTFGNTGENVSRLGFGAMRLPGMPDDDSKLDYDRAAQIMCRAFELGVNFVDTAYIYRGGQSEIAVGKALKQTKRKVLVSSKFPVTDHPKSGEYRRKLEISLERLGVDKVDFFYFHGIGRKAFDDIILPQGFLKEAIRAKEEGLIGHISFSFHDDADAMKYIIDRGEIFESVLCQYNILFRQNEEVMAYAKQRGLGVAVMGPLAGGKFMVSPEALKQMEQSSRMSSTAEIALRFVQNNPNVDIILSGMKSLEMVEENTRILSADSEFTPEEMVQLEHMIQENQMLRDCYCTECCYCLPCPQGINIPYIFRLLNLHKVDGLTEYAAEKYREIKNHDAKKIVMLSANVDIGSDPGKCINCGQCMGKCPQKLRIPAKLQESIQIFEHIEKSDG